MHIHTPVQTRADVESAISPRFAPAAAETTAPQAAPLQEDVDATQEGAYAHLHRQAMLGHRFEQISIFAPSSAPDTLLRGKGSASKKGSGSKTTGTSNNLKTIKKTKPKKPKTWASKKPPTKVTATNNDQAVIQDNATGPNPTGTLVRNDKGPMTGITAEFGPLGPYGYGTGMYAQIEDWNLTPAGSTPNPSVRPPFWPQSDDYFSKYMVQGHLLNENLGGPGTDMRNLAPISKKANKMHLQEVETDVKKAIIDNGGSGLYAVSVAPGPPAASDFPVLDASDKKAALADPNSKAILPLLPGGFECSVLDEDGVQLYNGTIKNQEA